MRTQRRIYDDIVNLLSLAQYRHLMGGDMSYESKAKRALKVSKSKKVQALVNELLNTSTFYGLDALQIYNIKRSERGELIGE